MALLQPKKLKYRTKFRGRLGGVPAGRSEIEFGEFALKSLEPGLLSAQQLEAARKAIVHHTKRRGRVWFRVFPDRPITRKPAEVRMGGGKGNVEGYAAGIKAGEIILEIGAVNEEVAREALRKASHKFPVRTRLISKEESR